MLNLNSSTNAFMGCECPLDSAEIVMFSAPFDSTVSFRPGARFAGGAIRQNSFGIESYSPYMEKDLFDLRIADIGELELPFGNAVRALDLIEQKTEQIIKNAKPFMIGGEHLVTLGAVRAMLKKYPDLHILHFDAHADLRDNYLGEKLSHATVIRRCWEFVGDKRIYQAGIRSGDAEEFDFAANHTILSKFSLGRMENFVRALAGKPVYFSLDLDILDPSIFPGTGTPEPGGCSFKELHDAVLLLKKLNIVGCDVVELSPHYDHSGISVMAACKIIREILMVMSFQHSRSAREM
ncbi:MAG: agmatinase [Defluviitaleaceae bacterium]|nr:agmatinase [Defluviitaleaceae bacterium]